MEEYIEQISKYFENVPLWPFFLLGFVCFVALAVEIVNRKRHEEAINCFREMFEIGLPGLYPEHTRWPENVNAYLCSRLPEMQQNFEVLRVFIPQKQLREYNIAWNKFRDFCINITDEKCATNEQSPESPKAGKEDDLVKEFHQLIDDLLVYAKPK
ncbi:MAG: hypothetical protein KDF59_08455 [Nitrosomonas sp.]|nr:hypothetical protein [Nitrosomonas sp.]